MSAGRPTKYSEEMLTRSVEYIRTYQDHGDAIPSAAGLAGFLGVSKRVLYDWAERHSKFLHMLETLNSVQERRLLSSGLTSEFNSTIVKLVLSKHGYSDKIEQDVTVHDYKVIPADLTVGYEESND